MPLRISIHAVVDFSCSPGSHCVVRTCRGHSDEDKDRALWWRVIPRPGSGVWSWHSGERNDSSGQEMQWWLRSLLHFCFLLPGYQGWVKRAEMPLLCQPWASGADVCVCVRIGGTNQTPLFFPLTFHYRLGFSPDCVFSPLSVVCIFFT